MNDSATSLDRLHDIVVPPAVPLWPPAPGWYVVLALASCALIIIGYRLWRRWQSNAYRREALRELNSVDNPAEIAALLRRVALAIAPREAVVGLSGRNWTDWLAARCPDPMPDVVRGELTIGVYRDASAEGDSSALKAYAQRWISHHQPPATEPSA